MQWNSHQLSWKGVHCAKHLDLIMIIPKCVYLVSAEVQGFWPAHIHCRGIGCFGRTPLSLSSLSRLSFAAQFFGHKGWACFRRKFAHLLSQVHSCVFHNVESVVHVHAELCKGMPMTQQEQKLLNPRVMGLRKEILKNRKSTLPHRNH